MRAQVDKADLDSAREPRRRHPRIPFYSRLEFADAKIPRRGITFNLAVGGVGFYVRTSGPVQETLATGDRVRLQIRIPNPVGEVILPAELGWVGSAKRDSQDWFITPMGARFTGGCAQVHEGIARFIKEFRYRIIVYDCELQQPLRQQLGDRYDVVSVSSLDEIRKQPERVALIVLGEGSDPIAFKHSLRSLLAEQSPVTAARIVCCVRSWPDDLKLDPSDHGRVVFLNSPPRPRELTSVAQHCIASHLLAVENAALNLEFEGTLRKLRTENVVLRERLAQPQGLPGVIGTSEQLQSVASLVERVAPLDTGVLILGETGTGKELISKAIHRLSSRSDNHLVVQNCAGIPDTLLESELFGHKRGAFTGASRDHEGMFGAANGGTLFLDEVAEMSAGMQAKLLRVLQDGEVRRVGETKTRRVDVRIIAATHADLEGLTKTGAFREDLFYRLSTFVVHLCPLRERTEDISSLVMHFLASFAARYGREAGGISAEALSLLEAYAWPGNVRQLKQVIERISILSPPGTVVSATIVRQALGQNSDGGAPQFRAESLEEATADFQRRLVTDALDRNDWVMADAARELKVTRTTLMRRCRKLGLGRPS